jgi:hypothetical protein
MKNKPLNFLHHSEGNKYRNNSDYLALTSRFTFFTIGSFLNTALVLLFLVVSQNANAQDFKNLSFNEITNGKLDYWVLDGDYSIITQDLVNDSMVLYNRGESFVKLYTSDTNVIQEARLVQRLPYLGSYIKNVSGRFSYYS